MHFVASLVKLLFRRRCRRLDHTDYVENVACAGLGDAAFCSGWHCRNRLRRRFLEVLFGGYQYFFPC